MQFAAYHPLFRKITRKKGKHLCTLPAAKIMIFRGDCKSDVKEVDKFKDA